MAQPGLQPRGDELSAGDVAELAVDRLFELLVMDE